MNFTHNNHLFYTVGDRKYGYRETIYEKYKVFVGEIDQDYFKKSNWVNEQYRTASLIHKEYGKDFVLCFSGGTDSEIVLRSFHHIGIIPRVVFIKFRNDYNLEDYIIAEKICNELSVKLEVIDFDVIDFYKSGEAVEFSKEIQCRQIAYLTVYNAIRKMELPAVMGGELLLRRHVTLKDSKWYYCFRENEDASAIRFSIKYNIPLVNEWFSYTPEMIGYYLNHPMCKKLVTDKYNYKLASVSTKNEILKTFMPSIIDKIKTHGYEKLLGFNGETYNQLYLSHTKRLESSLDGIFLDDLNNMLFGDNYVGS